MTRVLRLRGTKLLALALALSALSAVPALAQSAVLSGKVTSEQGMPLEFANVFILEMNVSASTDNQGAYRITVAPERLRGQSVQLRVRAIGYKPQAKAVTLVAGNITNDFALAIDVNKLSEVVITGTTGATEKAKLAFTVESVSAAEIPVPASNAITQLQGKVAGATISTPSGRPGENPSIVLRGPTMLNAEGRAQGPLIIVDGVVTSGSLGDINPQDIESIEIVKGAAASSTFGSRAGSGVIQITTKSGKNANQGARFNVRTETGFEETNTEYPFAKNHMIQMDETNTRFCITVSGQPTCSRTVDFEQEALRINEQGQTAALAPHQFERDYGIGRSPPTAHLRGLFMSNPWPKSYNPIAQTVTNGLFNNTNVDMTGRFGNTGFFASASNLLSEGTIEGLKGYIRNTARVNLDQAIGEDLSLQAATFYQRGTQYPNGAFFRLTRVPAGVDLTRRDKFGRLFVRSNPMDQGRQNANPIYDNLFDNEGKIDSDRYLASLQGNYNPLPWFTLDANVSIDRRRRSDYALRDRGFRVTSESQSTNFLGFMEYNTGLDQSINASLSATARQSNPLGIRDLDMRYNARYSFEREDDEDTEDLGGTTLAVPGLVSLDNVTVLQNPGSEQASVRAIGMLGGVALDYKGRYILDGTLRRDGSSLFGADSRWATYYRGSLAWRVGEETWWPWKGAVNDMKLRASVGTAGGRPRFSAQYETFSIGAGGTVSGATLGNRELRPEKTTETEFGFDAELFSKYGVTMTYARGITRDQILEIPPSVSTGFSNQWKNGGTIDNKTYEATLNIPLITKRNVVWSTRLTYDRNRAIITGLDIPPFFDASSNAQFLFAVGERIGTVWGRYFARACSQLPSQFAADCGAPGKSYQYNSDGYVVWTGGRAPGEGITNNLWQSTHAGCMRNGVALNLTGEVECARAGGTVNNPWAVPQMTWGMPIVLRDSTGNPLLVPLGNTQPDFHLAMSHTFQFKRLNLYALVDGSYGRKIFNQEIHWSLGDFNVEYEDQAGQTVETAKPIGYYWRSPAPFAAGVGGFYDALGSNNQTVEKGTYTKLREVSVGYSLGPIRGVGDWTLSLIGRNLWTITDFIGWDPETGAGDGTILNSGAIGGVAAFQYPQKRTFTFGIQTRF